MRYGILLLLPCLAVLVSMLGCGDDNAERAARLHAEKMANAWLVVAVVLGAAGLAVCLKKGGLPVWFVQFGQWVIIAGSVALILLVGLDILKAVFAAIASIVESLLTLAICACVGWWLINAMGRKR